VLSLNFYHDSRRKSEVGGGGQAKPQRPRKNRSLLSLLLES